MLRYEIDGGVLYGRVIFYAKFPLNMRGTDVVKLLSWAKTWKVDSMSSEYIVRCIVKPQYEKHFREENESRLLDFEVNTLKDGDLFFTVKVEKNTSIIFEE